MVSAPITAELLAQAEGGDREAQFKLGSIFAKRKRANEDWLKSIHWFKQSAEQGYAPAQFALGFACTKGYGLARDYSMAYRYYREAAEQGHDFAQLNLGILCLEGKVGVERQDDAADWFLKSAEQGNAKAQASLAMHYLTGFGVKRDKITGLAWLELFCRSGYKSWPHRAILYWSRLWLSSLQRKRLSQTVRTLSDRVKLIQRV